MYKVEEVDRIANPPDDLYQYDALDQSGREINGEIQGSNAEEALAKVRNMGYFPTHITPKTPGKSKKKAADTARIFDLFEQGLFGTATRLMVSIRRRQVWKNVFRLAMVVGSITFLGLAIRHFTFAEPQAIAETFRLPAGAANVVDRGNGWTEFTLEGTVYLYHRSSQGDIVMIPQGIMTPSGEQPEKVGW